MKAIAEMMRCIRFYVILFSSNESFPGNIAFYMAILPRDYGQVISNLHKNSLLDENNGWKRVVIEKPFGYDLESAQGLNAQISEYLREDQVYRTHH